MTKKQLMDELEALRARIDATPDTADIDLDPYRGKLADIVFENTREGILVADEQQRIIAVNPAFCKTTGYDAEELIGRKPSILKSNRHSDWFYRDMHGSLNDKGRWSGKVWDRRKNGEVYPCRETIIAFGDSEGAPRRYVAILNDISREPGDFPSQANYDALTGLPNRQLFNDRLNFMVAHAKRNKQILAVLYLDIDRFKFTNDSLGYTAGDILLQTVALRLRETVREVDAVFRLGNDEFAIVLEEIAHVQDAAKVAKKIQEIFEKPFEMVNVEHEIYLSVSVGISLYPHDGQDVERLVRNAETAMYRAKEQGENTYQHYAPSMNATAFKQLTLEYRMHKALKQGEFVVYYQPQIDLLDNRIVGAEALIRWKHPDLGLVPPGDFIPVAEETGLIVPIGEWVLRTAIEQARKWQDSGFAVRRIAVNLSARQFQEQGLLGKVALLLKEAAFEPRCLELEITESIGMRNAERTISTLSKLKGMGVRLSIDDFGTGYSSLSYLKRFPIDTLKVDRSFVMDIGEDPDDEAIVALIVAMAHTLKLTVVAEGVENEKQLQFLKQHGCEEVQGYFFSPPVPAEEFEKLLREQGKRL